MAGRVIKESYGADKGQHTFTIEVCRFMSRYSLLISSH